MQTREATGGGHNGTAPVDPAAVREELEWILASPQFRNSKRHSCFLRYVVEETLRGEAGQLKERTVGVRVFGLEPGYDTSTNPVVRVSAGELRKRLLQYYHAPDHGGEPRIDLPPGSYVPEFAPARFLRAGVCSRAGGSGGTHPCAAFPPSPPPSRVRSRRDWRDGGARPGVLAEALGFARRVRAVLGARMGLAGTGAIGSGIAFAKRRDRAPASRTDVDQRCHGAGEADAGSGGSR